MIRPAVIQRIRDAARDATEVEVSIAYDQGRLGGPWHKHVSADACGEWLKTEGLRDSLSLQEEEAAISAWHTVASSVWDTAVDARWCSTRPARGRGVSAGKTVDGGGYVTIAGVRMPFEAAEVVEATGTDVAADLRRVRNGEVDRDALLAECLVGAEGDDVASAWRSYVSAIFAL